MRPITAAASVMTMMRERSRDDVLVRTISASMKAEVRTSPPQAAREKASRMARAITPSAKPARKVAARRAVTTFCSASSAGRMRNAPSTLGSLKVPRARPYRVRRS